MQHAHQDCRGQDRATCLPADLRNRAFVAQHRYNEHQRDHRDVLQEQNAQRVAAVYAVDFRPAYQQSQHAGGAAQRNDGADCQRRASAEP